MGKYDNPFSNLKKDTNILLGGIIFLSFLLMVLFKQNSTLYIIGIIVFAGSTLLAIILIIFDLASHYYKDALNMYRTLSEDSQTRLDKEREHHDSGSYKAEDQDTTNT